MSNTKKRYNEDFKKQLVELYNLGKSVTELSDEYGVTPPTIYSWIKLYSTMEDPDGEDITVSDYKKLKKEIELLRMENEILKKATAIFAKHK